jgi:hypothetical protein
MSRLDSVIERLKAQRSVLDAAAEALADTPGHILELGLGNGRTYDHLRQLFPGRDIYVFDREVASHPDCRPDPEFLFLGPMAQTLVAAAARLGANAALVHADIGYGDPAATIENVRSLGPKIPALLRPGGIVLCDQSLDAVAALHAIALPADIAPGRYHAYRRD